MCMKMIVHAFSRSLFCFFFFKQKTAYEMRISDWSSDVCSSDLVRWPIGTGEICCLALGFLLGAAYIEGAKTTEVEFAFKIASVGLLLEVDRQFGGELFPFFGKDFLDSQFADRLERGALVAAIVLDLRDSLVFVISEQPN